jgi:hypothetical protein
VVFLKVRLVVGVVVVLGAQVETLQHLLRDGLAMGVAGLLLLLQVAV